MKENKKYALLIVDMVNDFIYGKLGFEEGEELIKPHLELIKFAHENKIPVIYACDSHYPKIDHEFTHWDEHAIKDDESSKIIKELKPTKDDYVILKRRYSAFLGTDLDLLAKELKIDSFIITGVQTHICVIHSVSDAFMRGYETILAKEATASFTKTDYDNSLKYMKEIYGTKLLSNKEIVSLIK